MTGFGRFLRKDGDGELLVEVRSVNNRYLKTTVKIDERCSAFEDRILKEVKKRILRGTVDVTVKSRKAAGSEGPALDPRALRSVAESWRELAVEMGFDHTLDASAVFAIPGIWIEQSSFEGACEDEWDEISAGVEIALNRLVDMRNGEGAAMAADLRGRIAAIAGAIEEVKKLAPAVVEEYRRKLDKNVAAALSASGQTVAPEDLMREIAVFADRSDINEECVRAGQHLDEFIRVLDAGGEAGRKMEFIAQELLREVNTLGAKANNYSIAKLAVEAKTEIEKIKEIVQNLE